MTDSPSRTDLSESDRLRRAKDAYYRHVAVCPFYDPRRCLDCDGLEKDASAEAWRRQAAREQLSPVVAGA